MFIVVRLLEAQEEASDCSLKQSKVQLCYDYRVRIQNTFVKAW